MELSYADLEKEISAEFANAQTIVFATCADNIVTARTVNPVNDGITILFGTDDGSTKVEQAKQNANVALVCGGIQIEATAELWGSPSKSKDFQEKIDAKFPWMKEAYPPDPEGPDTGMLVICHPTKISFYKYLDGEGHWDVLYVKEQRAERK